MLSQKRILTPKEEGDIKSFLANVENFCPQDKRPQQIVLIKLNDKSLRVVEEAVSHFDSCFSITGKCLEILINLRKQRKRKTKTISETEQTEFAVTNDALSTIIVSIKHGINCIGFSTGREILDDLRKSHPQLFC